MGGWSAILYPVNIKHPWVSRESTSTFPNMVTSGSKQDGQNPNRRLQNSSPQTNGWSHGCYIHFIQSMVVWPLLQLKLPCLFFAACRVSMVCLYSRVCSPLGRGPCPHDPFMTFAARNHVNCHATHCHLICLLLINKICEPGLNQIIAHKSLICL